MARRTLTASLLVALAGTAGLTGCGSSKAPGVVPAPSAGVTQAPAAAITQATTTQTTPAATTPKPPSPLSKKPAVSVPSGSAPAKLVTKDLITGTGAAAKAGVTITFNYVGVLYQNGKQFDASWDRGQPLTAKLAPGAGGLIDGWVQGIPGMRVGGRRELIIPPSLAYGKAGRSPGIPPNATLVFVIDLLAAS